MTYKELKNQIKEEQKVLAKQITRGKFLRKLKNQSTQTEEEKKFYGNTTNWIWHNTKVLSKEYRSIHVAYCTFFNKTPLEKIENKVRPGSYFDGSLYSFCIKEWERLLPNEEAVCPDKN